MHWENVSGTLTQRVDKKKCRTSALQRRQVPSFLLGYNALENVSTALRFVSRRRGLINQLHLFLNTTATQQIPQETQHGQQGIPAHTCRHCRLFAYVISKATGLTTAYHIVGGQTARLARKWDTARARHKTRKKNISDDGLKDAKKSQPKNHGWGTMATKRGNSEHFGDIDAAAAAVSFSRCLPPICKLPPHRPTRFQ